MELFHPEGVPLTKYLFYTGKGGVGKTSVACATAVALADQGKRVLLVSTDPASNLQDVFALPLTNRAQPIPGAPGLAVANLDPVQAAAEYRESVVAPYRGKLPQSAIANMEEQLSGSCTVEIAAFNEFSHFITDGGVRGDYDHILFDTAPTGHTLRLLQLPSAWSGFISQSTHGASCLGQLAGLEEKREVYRQAVDTLADGAQTTLVLVARPEEAPLAEAERASAELRALGVENQILVVNGLLETWDDSISQSLYQKQRAALGALPQALGGLPAYMLPLRGYNVTGLDRVRALLTPSDPGGQGAPLNPERQFVTLGQVTDQLAAQGKRVIFTMGKGGVGKTTVAAAIALGLARRGKRVHLATTDPAAHLKFVLEERQGVTMSHIDQQAELEKYQAEVLEQSRAAGMSGDDLAYVQEDLRSPCTQEIAVFRAFADLVERAEDEVVVIDTAPTGHTLLLLESTQSYHHEIQRTRGAIPASVRGLLPRLRGAETEVIIVTLPEATPVYEALRLETDLARAGLSAGWWVINQSLCRAGTENQLLRARAEGETEWIDRVDQHTKGCLALISWSAETPRGEGLLEL